ncbi:Bcr/CflA family efflux MFS transporter [Shewanella sp. SNU WT4]|uniref:Bcr/CflA family efflux MFS transporter n=1 Tax=Shewanella sp. SNU WT4 TaxID=2590015 RepID=UPI001126344C|nr:Bcr/CflA family efflux MFS transporter [Shewanella sp. SNU WT4]QDF66825.1 Bcr/CflA family efflux MFS transporter [Shewanella sp. SNU WT4]
MNSPKVNTQLILFLAAIIAISPLTIDMYLPAMPAIAENLSTSIGLVQLSMSLYLAGYATGMLLLGPLADKWGRIHILRLGLSGFLITSLLLSISNDISHFLVLRFVQAFFGAAATVVVPGYIRQLFGAQMAKGMSYVSLIMMVAPLIAPSIGAGLLNISTWPAIFILLSAYTAILLGLTWKMDLPAMPASSKEPISYLGRYRRVFSTPKVLPLIANSMLSSFAFFTYLTAAPLIYMAILGISAEKFALLFALNVGSLMLANLINTRIVGKLGSLTILKWAAGSALIIALLLVVASVQTSILAILCLVPAIMLCIGLMSVNSDALLLIRFQEDSGTATAVMGTLKFGVGALAGPLLAIAPHSLWLFPVMLSVILVAIVINLRLNQT